MESYSIHGQDVSSVDLPSTHRLPTVSAADALEELHDNPDRYISTGLEPLDAALSNEPEREAPGGGIQRGQITEIWGPPGAGKTTLGIELASNALAAGKGVVWIDTLHPVSQTRLAAICDAKSMDPPLGWKQRLRHFMISSLPHFIALLCRPTATAIPDDTILIVVDSLPSLINHAYPRAPDYRCRSKAKQESSARRVQVLQFIVGSLQKLAATRDVAIVFLTPCATKMQAERGAMLVPAINASWWDQGVMWRIVLFREWIWHEGKASSGRFAGLQKLNGKVCPGAMGPIVAFAIEERGIVPANYSGSRMSVTISTTPTKKHETRVPGGEVPDSEDEEYGWDDDDEEAFLKMPTQWQGSEDILLGKDGAEEEEAPPNGSSEESEEDEGEEDGDDADDE